MWSPSFLYYVVCPRATKFLDYFPAMLRRILATETFGAGLRGPQAETPTVEVTVLTCRSASAGGMSLATTEETVASVTLTDPSSGRVVANGICIGTSSAVLERPRPRLRLHAAAPPRRLRGPALMASSGRMSRHAAHVALWAGDSGFRRGCCGRQQRTGLTAATWKV